MNNYKNINITKTISILAVSALLSTAAYADTSDSMLALGAKIGTTGFGIEARSPIADNLYGRFGANYFHYNLESRGTLDLKGRLTFLTVPLMLDYHPFDDSGFRLSAGIAYNGNKLTASATPTTAVILNGTNYTPAQLGAVKAKLTLGNKIAPIVSIGYDNSFMSDSPWSFNAEAGVMYAGKAKFKVSATGLASTSPQTIDDINKYVNKDLNKIQKYLKFFPILSIGLKYTF